MQAPCDLRYLLDTYCTQTDIRILSGGSDDDGPYVVTDHSIYYPGGGGQEADKGWLIRHDSDPLPILKARFKDGQWRHYVPELLEEGQELTMNIDAPFRLLNARLHTAGHLLSSLVYEVLNWPVTPVKGFHYQQGAYVEFELNREWTIPGTQLLEDLLLDAVNKSLPVTVTEVDTRDPLFHQALKPEGFKVPEGKTLRLVQTGSFRPIPCGGTHVANGLEVGTMTIRHCKLKKGQLRIGYDLAEGSPENPVSLS